MRLVTCKLMEIDEWFGTSSDLPRKQQSELDMGEGFRASIGPHGNSILIRDSKQRRFVVKLLKGSMHDKYDQFGAQVYNSRPALGRIELQTYQILSTAINKWKAYWFVIDEY